MTKQQKADIVIISMALVMLIGFLMYMVSLRG